MIRPRIVTGIVVALGLLVAGCGASQSSPGTGGSSSPASAGAGASSASSEAPLTESKTLQVVTHESFAVDPKLLDKFKADTGYDVKITSTGDAGTVVNQLVLTKDSPTADVVFGIDNTFAGRAIGEDLLAPYEAPAAADIPDNLRSDDQGLLTPIDLGDVCLNADTAWFKDKGLEVPATLDDLTKPEYKDQLVVENPASSSPGLAFLVATYGKYGDGWKDYWTKLKNNGAKVVAGWTEAYSVEFSGSSGKGTRPLVVSYSTSPAFEVPEGGGDPSTTALLGTCFRQVEYAAILKGAKNEVGARKFIDFLLSNDVQKTIPETMYMYPAVPDIELPADWKKYAPLADDPIAVDPQVIAQNRDQWVKDWTGLVLG